MRSPRPVQATPLLAALLILSGCGSGASPRLASPVAPTLTSAASATTLTTPTSPPASMPVDPNATPIHLLKDCSEFTGEIPSHCTISRSDYAPIPVGTRINYLGPLLTSPRFLSSNVVIDARGSTATGYCTFDPRPTQERGLCTFWEGTRALAGFTAIFVVTIDTTGLWHLDGESYGTSPSPVPS